MCDYIQEFCKQSNAVDRQLLGIAALSLNDASGNQSASFSPEDQYYNSNEWYALSKTDKDKVLRIDSGRNGGKKANKLGGRSKSEGGGNDGKLKSKIEILEKKAKNQKRQLSAFNTAAKYGLENEESDKSDKEDGNNKNSDLTC